jgi:hypothetical protein
MRRVREILRLKHEGGATDRAIARSLSIARSTVALTLERVAVAGLRWPLPATLTDRVLEAMLYAGHGSQQGARRKTEPDWIYVHHELRRPGVTLMLLWYRQREPGGSNGTFRGNSSRWRASGHSRAPAGTLPGHEFRARRAPLRRSPPSDA